ncbi:hypothetical protein B0I35DRAFT_508815 [Stachybotrys elegans]|uniref:Mid2 domain-containing protein n=1 Tax=Stachybotrys elegans TaxID=80388 RepID=A0A8K0WWM2_9HYPO|nr:hypothetical protein B0I35DRAFT_508815 [Stachybotrys elegans]
MLVQSLLARSYCQAPEVFYSCGVINFRGCCIVDPCTLGSCPEPRDADDDETGGSQSQTEVTRVVTTATDSGITHTISNSEVITVTRRTTIVTDGSARPTPSATVSSILTTSGLLVSPGSTTTSSGLPVETSPGLPTSQAGEGGTLSTGAIVGVGVGGGMALALLAVAIFYKWRHSKLSRRERLNSRSADEAATDDLVEEKHFPTSISAHTTGTQRESDPFAPFGGRADIESDPHRPQSGVYEMDASAAVPVELPATIFEDPTATQAAASRSHNAVYSAYAPRVNQPAPGMTANLDGLGQDGNRPAYINHWNQYRDSPGR